MCATIECESTELSSWRDTDATDMCPECTDASKEN